MNPLLQTIGRLGIHQDLLWFLVLMGWCFVAALWWRVPTRHTVWSWVPWAAAAGILTALLQFLVFNPSFDLFHRRLLPGSTDNYDPALIDPDLFADMALATVYAGIAAIWWWRTAKDMGAKALRWPVIAICLGIVWLHYKQPLLGGALLALLPLKALTYLWKQSASKRWACMALVLAATLPLVSPISPLAVAADKLQRLGPTNWFGAACALVHLLALGSALIGMLRDKLQLMSPAARRAFWADAKPFLVIGGVWVAGGTAFALLSGHDNAIEVKTNRLRQTAARAEEFPRELADRILDPKAASNLAWEIDSLVAATPFAQTGRYLILHDGRMMEFHTENGILFSSPSVPATAQDEAEWAAHAKTVVTVPVPEAGRPYYTRAPLWDSKHHIAAWLEFEWVEFYGTMERNWRTAPLLVTALGAVLAAAFFVQRRSSREREDALRAAAVATEAGRVKTAFLAKVSHELRTPLQSILGYTELLQRELPDETGKPQLKALQHHSRLMTRLVNDLIDLSALESGAFRLVDEPVPLPELARQTVESFRPRAEAKGLRLDLSIDRQLPAWIMADASRLRQILLNLLSNAVKFTEIGGIDVTLQTDTADNMLHLSVRDTGPGIAPEDQARIFEPFSRLELTAHHEGSGLGLALVSGLCRSMGGTITVESTVGTGTSFYLRLPLHAIEAPTEKPVANHTSLLRGKRILIADDNDLVRELFTTYLTSLGADCIAVKNGEEALTAARPNPCDAIVLDLAMPGLQGTDVARELRAAGCGVRIIGVSAHTDAEERAAALAAGMDLCLMKPVELSALAEAIATSEVSMPPADRLRELREQLARRFRQELPAEIELIETALRARAHETVADGIHRLKNSAFAVGDSTLGKACAQMEQALNESDPAYLTAAWVTCTAALRPWLTTTQGQATV